MGDSDDESSKLDQSVVFVNEVKNEQTPVCKGDGCTKTSEFNETELIVRCLQCHGCYHQACAKIDYLDMWIGFMKSPKNREEWRYVCEFCKKEMHAMVRVKQLANLIAVTVKNNHEWLTAKTNSNQLK